MSEYLPASVTFPAKRIATDVGSLLLPADDQVLLPYMQRTGTWEPSEGRLLKSLLTPSSQFLDVGANVGYFTALAASVAPLGAIDAVEPDPRNIACLRMNVWALAPHARVHSVALGAQRDVVSMVFDSTNSGNTRVHSSGEVAGAHVPMLTADELFPNRSFDVVKVDVQGVEDQVILGMRKLLRRKKMRIVCEFFPPAIDARGASASEVLRLYRALGLDVLVYLNDSLQRMNDDRVLSLCADAGPQGYVNLLLSN